MNLVLEARNVVLVSPFTLFGGEVDRVGNPIDDVTRFSGTAKGTQRVEQQGNPSNEFSFALGSRHKPF